MITIQSFRGIAPRLNPRYLSDGLAQKSLDADSALPPLRPLNAPEDSGYTVSRDAKTVYLFGAQTFDPKWLEWDEDVAVVSGQIAGDIEEWTHYSGDSRHAGPRSTYASLGFAGSGPYPTESVPLGVPKPDTPPTVSVTGPVPDESTGETPETRVYTTTFVRNIGGLAAESAPSASSDDVDVYTDQQVFVDLPSLPARSNITHIRIYRSTGGAFLFVEEFQSSQAGTRVEDAVTADGLGEEIPSLFWSEPPDNIAGLTNLPNGIVAGYVGRDIYFSEPYRPYAWPQNYVQSLDYDVVGFGALDTTLVALTTGNPYLIQGASPEAMVVVRGGIEQACLSRRSIVSAQGSVYYASPDGLVRLSSSGSDIVTSELFSSDQWQALNPASMHAYLNERQYIAFYEGEDGAGALVYDLVTGQLSQSRQNADAAFRDVLSDTLYFKRPGSTKLERWQAGPPATAIWRSKVYGFPRPKGLYCGQVEAEGYPLTLRIYADSQLVHERTVTSREVFRFPAKKARDWEVELETDKEVFAVSLAQTVQELSSV